MNVPNLGGPGLSLGSVLLIAAAVLLGVPLLNEFLKSQEARAQQTQPARGQGLNAGRSIWSA